MASRVYQNVTSGAIDVPAPIDMPAVDDRVAALFDAHHERLYRLARRLSTTTEDARDLVQDTFVRVARSPGSVPADPAGEEAWLVRTLVNLCRDHWRRRGTRAGADRRGLTTAPVSARPTQEAALLAQDLVWKALRTLPPRQRAVLILHELDEVGIGDVARMLGVSQVTVRWHLSMGRRALARTIGKNSHA